MTGPECAIYFHPDAFTTNRERLMGRHVAGETFLKGYFQHSSAAALWTLVREKSEAEQFAKLARESGNASAVQAFTPDQMRAASKPGTIFYPGPDISELAFQRSFFGANQWSVCGITHTTSSKSSMDSIASWVTAPLNSWDAVICPSVAVKRHVDNIFQSEVARLQRRLGITKCPSPQLPVIPLGINIQDFQFSEQQKSNARQSLNIHPDEIVVLFVGRLSFHAKSHPLPMYKSLQTVAEETSKRIRLIECGWYANDYTENAYQKAREELCPNILVTVLDGRVRENRDLAWAGADIFCSLADNIQETFGISPIEAMAAGLPLVVADWDGYKDTVTPDCGYRVPTSMPDPGVGNELIFRHAVNLDNYDFYCGHTGIFVGVDIPSCCRAFTALVTDSALRAKMGSAARKRAADFYDWSKIIPVYEELWLELNARRNRSPEGGPKAWPARLDPYSAFQHYSTLTLSGATELRRCNNQVGEETHEIGALLGLEILAYAHRVLPSRDKLLATLLKTSESWHTVASLFGEPLDPETIKALSILHKGGLIEIKVADR